MSDRLGPGSEGALAGPELPEGDGEPLVGVVVGRRHHRHHRQAEDRAHVPQVIF